MSKELEALESLMKDYYEMCEDTGNNDDQYQKYNLTSEYHIIKAALEEYEEIKGLKIRSLSDAEMKQLMNDHRSIVAPYEGIPVDINLPKKLKALEIIKERMFLHSEYGKVSIDMSHTLTQEEFDLLREVFGQ